MYVLCSVYVCSIWVVYGAVIQTQRLRLIGVYTCQDTLRFLGDSDSRLKLERVLVYVLFWLFTPITVVISGTLC